MKLIEGITHILGRESRIKAFILGMSDTFTFKKLSNMLVF